MVLDLESDRGRGELVLGILRIVLGFMLIWAFLDKFLGLGMPTTPEAAMINGGSPTEYYLSNFVSGPLEGFYSSLAGNPALDLLLMAGLLLVGAAMILGVASRLSTVGMCVMMALMFSLEMPPDDNPLVDYHIVYILASIVIYYLGGYGALGLDGRWSELSIVKRFPILR